MTDSDSHQTASADNPAGRLLDLFTQFSQLRGNTNMAEGLAGVLGETPQSVTFPVKCAEVRLQAQEVRRLVQPYLPKIIGAEISFDGYDRVVAATDLFALPFSNSYDHFHNTITEKGWSALRWANVILSAHSPESTITVEQQRDFLKAVQDLIAEIAVDEAFTPADREHLTRMLRSVEDALIGIRIRGSQPLDAACSAIVGDAVARRDLWDRIAQSKWGPRFAGLVAAIILLLGGVSDGIQITQDLFPTTPAITAQPKEASDADEVFDAEIVDERGGP